MADPFFRPMTAASGAASYDAGLRAYMQRVFGYMAGGLALTGALAFLVSHTALINMFFAVSPAGQVHTTLFGMIAMFAPLALVVYMQIRMQSMPFGQLQTFFWIYCGLMGLSVAVLFLLFSGQDVARAFFITGADFGAMALFGYTTRSNLTGMGAFMMMGLMGLFIAVIANLFLMSSALQWVISVVCVIVFTGLTAYRVQAIKQSYGENGGADANNRMAVWGALMLYISFINLFQAILSLTGGNRN